MHGSRRWTWRAQRQVPARAHHRITARAQRRTIRHRAVVVQMQPRQQRLRIFTLQIINAAVRWIADEAAIVRDRLASFAQRGQHLRNRPGIAGEDEAAAQGDTERSARRMMPNFEHIEPQPLMPEPVRERHDAEGIPVIGTTFGQNAGIVRHALLHPRHQRRWQVKPAIAAYTTGICNCRAAASKIRRLL